MKRSSTRHFAFIVTVSILAALASVFVSTARADWNPGDPAKWVQLPDLQPTGMDVLATAPKILADDFLCTLTGPITDIHIWGSWLNDQHGLITNLHVSFHADIPAGPSVPSMPGAVLWQRDFALGQYVERPYAIANEAFYDPNINQIVGFDTQVFQYNMFIDPLDAFIQQVGNIYWLDVTATTQNGQFGWKTSFQHFNDDAVFDDLPQVPINWRDMHYPTGPFQGQSIDMAFALTTIPEPSSCLFGVIVSGLLLIACCSPWRNYGQGRDQHAAVD